MHCCVSKSDIIVTIVTGDFKIFECASSNILNKIVLLQIFANFKSFQSNKISKITFFQCDPVNMFLKNSG